MEVFQTKLGKRGVDVRSLDLKDPEKIGGDKMKQLAAIKDGVSQEIGKTIVRAIKDAKIKVTASIQGNAVRVSGAKKDDLQAAIVLSRKTVTELPLQFNNFRD